MIQGLLFPGVLFYGYLESPTEARLQLSLSLSRVHGDSKHAEMLAPETL